MSAAVDGANETGLDALFRPRAVAVIGASATPGKAGHAMFSVLRDYPGGVYPVNPRPCIIEGVPSVARLGDIDADVDLAVLTVPPQAVPTALEDCGRAGVGAAVICAGGFGETGPAGAALQDELAAIAERFGIRLLGPNTSGFLAPLHALYATFMPGVEEIPAGHVGVVAQSGGVNLATSFMLAERGHGVSLAVGLGNAVDVSFADVIDFLRDDPRTRTIALHVEGAGDGRALVEAISAAADVKPVVALKVGRTDEGAFAQSHTGALAGDWAVARSAMSQAGAVVVDTLTDLVDVSAALSSTRLPPLAEPGVAVVTGQAGPGLIIADTLRHHGVVLPTLGDETQASLSELLPPMTYQANPVDTGRPESSFSDVLRTVSDDTRIHATVVYALEEGGTDAMVRELIADREFSEAHPTVVASGGPADEVARHREALRGAGVAFTTAPDRAALVMSALVADSRSQHRRLDRSQAPTRPAAKLALPARRGALDEDEGKSVLSALGIDVPRRRPCRNFVEAAEFLASTGGKVVVKILDPAVTHKSAAGGVSLNVRTEEELADALTSTARAASSDAAWLVEEQVESGTEIIVGASRDPAFGPVVIVGPGGVDVDWLPAPAIRTVPLNMGDARSAVYGLPCRWLDGLGDHRDQLVDIVLNVADLMQHRPQVQELDINPLRVTDRGLVALDAVVVLNHER